MDEDKMIGRTFGELTVLSRAKNGKSGVFRYLCQCTCGHTTETRGGRLLSGYTTQCYNHKKILMGSVFGSFTVVRSRRGSPSKPFAPFYEVKCGLCSKHRWFRSDYLKTTPTCKCSYAPKNKGKGGENAYSSYVRDAKKRNMNFELSREVFFSLIEKDCFYCGAPPRKYYDYPRPRNGIDRVDNSIGYTEANSLPCCGQCNVSKRNKSQSEFIAWAQRLYLHITRTNLDTPQEQAELAS